MNNPNIDQSLQPKSIADVMELPEQQRQIVNWITHNPKVNLTQIAQNQNLSESEVENILQPLISEGFIAAIIEDEQIYYQRYLIHKPKSQLSPKIWDKL